MKSQKKKGSNSLLTYKVKHNRDFSIELIAARKVAEYAIANRDKLSTKYVKHLGLKAAVSGQILRKYGLNRKCKSVTRVKLTVGTHRITVRKDSLWMSSLKLEVPFTKQFERVNQIEIDNKYVYVTVTVKDADMIKPTTSLGVDLNTTGFCVVVACPET